MSTWHFFDNNTGLFSGRSFSGPESMLEANTPEGFGAYQEQEGEPFDHVTSRINLGSGELVAFLPPKPPDDDDTDWQWDTEIRRWLAMPSLAKRRRDASAVYIRQIEQIEADTARALRESVIASAEGQPLPAAAISRLTDADNQISLLRQRLTAIRASENPESI